MTIVKKEITKKYNKDNEITIDRRYYNFEGIISETYNK